MERSRTYKPSRGFLDKVNGQAGMPALPHCLIQGKFGQLERNKSPSYRRNTDEGLILEGAEGFQRHLGDQRFLPIFREQEAPSAQPFLYQTTRKRLIRGQSYRLHGNRLA